MVTNLDALCAQCAQKIVKLSGATRDKDLENHLRNALGVLQEDGFYAFHLFLRYRKLDRQSTGPKDKAWRVWPELEELLQKPELGAPLQGAGEKAVIQMTGDLQNLLLAKQLTERTLIYALYGVRSLPGGGQDDLA
jgi:hypothetical protein